MPLTNLFLLCVLASKTCDVKCVSQIIVPLAQHFKIALHLSYFAYQPNCPIGQLGLLDKPRLGWDTQNQSSFLSGGRCCLELILVNECDVS